MSIESHQDVSAHRIKRKPPPPFPYSARYPEPDPTDPFAPLSALRDRTGTLGGHPPHETPVVAPDSAHGSSKVHDLASFIMRQRKKSTTLDFPPQAEARWTGLASQLRKGTSMGLGLHAYASESDEQTTADAVMTAPRSGGVAIQRHESRRRSQSVFALRSRTFSFMEPRTTPERQSHADLPSRPHSMAPYSGSSSSVLTSSSASSAESGREGLQENAAAARRRSRSSSLASATLLDGTSELTGNAIPVRKSMHIMQVDMPASQDAEDRAPRLALRFLSQPPPLEKRTPSASSIDSWSRDLAFYSATSRPQTPSSLGRSSRPASVPPAALSFPLPPVGLPPFTTAPFTTSPLATSPPRSPVALPPTLATSLPPSPPSQPAVADLDALPLQLNFRFPKHERSVESEPESVERETGRFARLRARTSMVFQTRKDSAESSHTAADATIKSVPEVVSVPKLLPAPKSAAGTQVATVIAERVVTPSITEPLHDPRNKEMHKRNSTAHPSQSPASVTHPVGQTRPADPVPAPPLPRGDQEAAPTASRIEERPTSPQPIPARPVAKADPEPSPETAPALKRRSPSHGSHKAKAGRSASTPLPPPRPLPSPPRSEASTRSPPTPPPRASGHTVPHVQVQQVIPPPLHSAPPTVPHIVHATPSVASHHSQQVHLPAPRATTAPVYVAHTPSQSNHSPPLALAPSRAAQSLPPPPRGALQLPLPPVHVAKTASSASSYADNMSTTSAPVRRRDASPSSSTDRVQYQSHQSHGHHHGHHHHSGHPRSLSEPSAGTGLSASQIAHAARMPLVRENGVRVLFGELWRAQRTAVFFIRHFWCPLCQDYLASLMRDVDHAALARAGVRVVVIGCGSYSLIRPYRQIFHLPYELLVDASSGQALYRALGMGRLARGNNGGGGAGAGTGAGKPGAYVRHGAVSGLAMVVGHALRVGMPPWERGGDATQLGGEFVFGPGLSCTYAHRMQSAAGHAPVVDVLAAAGVRGVHKGAAAAATTAPSIRRNISLPLERPGAVVATGTAAGRDTKVLSVVREEGCAGDGVCGADSVSVDWESTTSGEWGLVAAHGHGATR